MSQVRRFIQCDVFTPEPTRGNALAVVVDGDGLSDEAMQHFARWTNLAETTFLMPPVDESADYRVRIFTPYREMPFAGHPTLGSCASWLHSGGTPRQAGVVRQECQIGVVEIDLRSDPPAFIAPPTRIEALSPDALDAILVALDLPREAVVASALLDNGPVWQALELVDAETVLALDLAGLGAIPGDCPLGFTGVHSGDGDSDREVRMVAPGSGEDPITGSLNAALGHWMIERGVLSGSLRVAQGTRLGCIGRVHLSVDPDSTDTLRVGGQTHILVEGKVRL